MIYVPNALSTFLNDEGGGGANMLRSNEKLVEYSILVFLFFANAGDKMFEPFNTSLIIKIRNIVTSRKVSLLLLELLVREPIQILELIKSPIPKSNKRFDHKRENVI